MRHVILLIIAALFVACGTSETKKEETKKAAKPTHYGRNIDNMVRIVTYDVYNQKIADGMGVYVAPDIVVTPFEFIKGAFSAKANKMDSKQVINVFGFVAYDIDNNLVALRIGKRIQNINPIDTVDAQPTDTLYTLDSKKGKTLRTTYTADTKMTAGAALFDTDGNTAALADGEGNLIDATKIRAIASRLGDGHENIYDLRLKTNKVYPSYKTISGFKIMTTMGDITIRLYNETPEYRDNFIKLVSDNFYDSLLVHRVLQNYLIQTGAADSKYAKKDDVVGWQGPGYKIPMHLVDGIFHKRGVVSASKLPSDHNSSNRSDGSQFFIVSGRKFNDTELNEIEKDYGKRFTAAQREAYKTVGGAPYLDGDYTIFGEVVSGMDIVDKIAAVELIGDRPKTDIRVKDIVMLKR
ncbi:MAG: peptidylprolyl isomerase [Bacteroidales bacterium]|nr:peptidylprolyl isomerase [Bacteroidales bacterium]